MAQILLGLELSSKEIRYTFLERKQKRGVLLKAGKVPFSEGTSLKNPANLKGIIQEFLKQENISPHKIFLTLSGSREDLLIHQINLPKMSQAELGEVISGEIERIPKFANKEFDYTYAASRIDEQKQRVLFCAMAKESLDAFVGGLKQTGKALESLEISPLNLLEIFYNQVDKDKAEALLVLDDRASYVAIFWQNECKLFFQMASGRSDLYQGKELNRGTFSIWMDDVKRVFKSYQREFGARFVDKLWFIWDKENAPGLDSLIAKEVEMELIVPALENFSINLQNKELDFNPLYFLSLASPLIYIKGIKEKFDFKHFLRKTALQSVVKKAITFGLIYIALISTILGIFTARFLISTKKISISEKEAAKQVMTLEIQTVELRQERDDYLDIKSRLLKQAAYVRMLNRISWSEIFGKICSALPDNISLSSFQVPEGGQVRIEGSTFAIDSIAELIRKINSLAFLENAQFDFLREREVENKRIVEFGIITKLKAEQDVKK